MTEHMFNHMGLAMADFECQDSVRRENTFTGDQCGDGAVKGETVAVGRVGGVADEGAGVFVVFDRRGEGVVDVERDVGRVGGDDVKGRWGIEPLE